MIDPFYQIFIFIAMILPSIIFLTLTISNTGSIYQSFENFHIMAMMFFNGSLMVRTHMDIINMVATTANITLFVLHSILQTAFHLNQNSSLENFLDFLFIFILLIKLCLLYRAVRVIRVSDANHSLPLGSWYSMSLRLEDCVFLIVVVNFILFFLANACIRMVSYLLLIASCCV